MAFTPVQKKTTQSIEEFLVPEKVPVKPLWSREIFEGLTDREKRYLYHMSRACWLGGSIVLKQVSPESIHIYRLLREFFNRNYRLVEKEEGYEELCQYAAQFMGNLGNYSSYGDQKFIPRCSQDRFRTLVFSVVSPSARSVSDWIDQTIEKIYSLSEKEKMLGFPDKFTSAYYSEMMSEEEIKRVNRYMASRKIGMYNTTVERRTDPDGVYYVIVQAGVGEESKSEPEPESELVRKAELFERHRMVVVAGNYQEEMKQIVAELEEARKYVANETQDKMIREYQRHFMTGNEGAHMDAQRHWVKDQQPIVETNLGFIESYRDPSGVRGEFEGFAAIVDRTKSRIFNTLVESSEALLPKLPWPEEFGGEFLKPDFTSLEIVAFCGSGIPLGINIPNYAEIRQVEGFKNVSLGNILEASFTTPEGQTTSYLSSSDDILYKKYAKTAFGVQVGGHELLGHGSGKLFWEKNGELNFDPETRNPMTGGKITSWYQEGESYSSVFGALAGAYEECRAECVGLLLSTDRQMLKIFEIPEKEQLDVMYTNWLLMARSGVNSLLMYSPEEEKWRQAHSHARFVILNVLLQDAPELLELTFRGENDLLINLNREKILETGVEAIRNFLTHLQVYKSTADLEAATRLFKKYGSIDSTIMKLRDIAFHHRQPRGVYIQPTLRLRNLSSSSVTEVVMDYYPEDEIGMIHSVLQKVGDV